MKWFQCKIIVFILLIALILTSFAGEVSAKKKKAPEKPALPPYRSSGPIPGTSLAYENLFIDDSGRATLSVYNPELSGVRFRASFSFYNAKNGFILSFGLDGFAPASASTGYNVKLADHKKLKQAAYMTVLGRAGRLGGDTWE
ncbi:MAG: hypothetical protein LBT31_00275 [Synergistaceae bacterium]|nr:hypothetical protein [Synergistaceae bacterium]